MHFQIWALLEMDSSEAFWGKYPNLQMHTSNQLGLLLYQVLPPKQAITKKLACYKFIPPKMLKLLD